MTRRTQIKRFQRLATRMESIPRNTYDQDVICHSACCLIGHTILEMGTVKEQKAFAAAQVGASDVTSYNVVEKARDLLGLPRMPSQIMGGDGPAKGIFDMSYGWPDEFLTRTGNVTPRLAAKRLRAIAAKL